MQGSPGSDPTFPGSSEIHMWGAHRRHFVSTITGDTGGRGPASALLFNILLSKYYLRIFNVAENSSIHILTETSQVLISDTSRVDSEQLVGKRKPLCQT